MPFELGGACIVVVVVVADGLRRLSHEAFVFSSFKAFTQCVTTSTARFGYFLAIWAIFEVVRQQKLLCSLCSLATFHKMVTNLFLMPLWRPLM